MYRIAWNLFISGVLFGAGPCVASCGPVLLTYIAGTDKGPRAGLAAYTVFSLTRLIVYVFLSAVAFTLGMFALEQGIQRWAGAITIAGGVFIILLAVLTLLSPGCSKMLKVCRGPLIVRDRKSVFTLGLIAGITPCAPLVGVLSYIAFVSKSWPEALMFGASFGAGTFVSPLLLLAGMAGYASRISVRTRESYARVLKLVCALVLIFLGAQLILRGVLH